MVEKKQKKEAKLVVFEGAFFLEDFRQTLTDTNFFEEFLAVSVDLSSSVN